ncbi:hypothetical protein [Pseudomonas batumici]|uniref:Uncharacterized protein n=1 Tax=Pseudomonas batumici TaxID=226910 RepID=A0A0C2IC29_9PSED|nr:hypothetical protein [Pseudomonas batumici]KIH84490.1 hypothetical protein UCMB321_1721 [Pseudomonas batumici]
MQDDFGDRQRRESLNAPGIHLLGLGVGAGLILGLMLLICLLTVNFR